MDPGRIVPLPVLPSVSFSVLQRRSISAIEPFSPIAPNLGFARSVRSLARKTSRAEPLLRGRLLGKGRLLEPNVDALHAPRSGRGSG